MGIGGTAGRARRGAHTGLTPRHGVGPMSPRGGVNPYIFSCAAWRGVGLVIFVFVGITWLAFSEGCLLIDSTDTSQQTSLTEESAFVKYRHLDNRSHDYCIWYV